MAKVGHAGPALAVMVVLAGACADGPLGRNDADGRQPNDDGEITLVTVNGSPITNHDVAYFLRADAHSGAVTAELETKALERLIERELAYQEALSLGYDRDEKYRSEVLELRLALKARQRTEMVGKLYAQKVMPSAEVSAAEARAYYEAHQARFETELLLDAVAFTAVSAAEEFRQRLARGEPWDRIAPSHRDAGFVSADAFAPWSRIPFEWHEVVYALDVGEESAVFAGSRTGVWVFKLLARRSGPRSDFGDVRSRITVRLHEARAGDAYAEYLDGLRERATIERRADP